MTSASPGSSSARAGGQLRPAGHDAAGLAGERTSAAGSRPVKCIELQRRVLLAGEDRAYPRRCATASTMPETPDRELRTPRLRVTDLGGSSLRLVAALRTAHRPASPRFHGPVSRPSRTGPAAVCGPLHRKPESAGR